MTEYTSRVEEILNGTFTGEPQSRVEALLIAWIQSGGGGGSGVTNYAFLTNLPKINGVELKGNKTSADLGIVSGSGALESELTVTKTVGGISQDKTYAVGTPLETILRDLLNPVENPRLTAPSATISTTGNLLLEPGETQNVTITITFNQGSISPANGTSGKRAGEATGYALNNGSRQTSNTFSVTVTESNKIFVGNVDHTAGEQPKNSKGENFSSPYPAGTINTSELKFEYVSPIWSNARVITTIDKEQLISKSAGIKTFNFPAQTAENPQTFDVPASWNVTAVEIFNGLSNSWQNGSSSFTVTDTTHDGIAYKRYTDNRNAAAGARQVRFKWTP